MDPSANFLEKVTIKLDNKKPIEVMDFLTSINAFQKQYRLVCKEEGYKYENEEVKPYIQLREGCVEWDFIRRLVTKNPILLGTISPAVFLLRKTAEILIEKVIEKIIKGEGVETSETNTLSNARDLLAVQKNDSGSDLSVNYKDCNNNAYNFNNCIFHGTTSRGVTDFLEDQIRSSKQINVNCFSKVLLYLDTACKENGSKGIIEADGFDPKKSVRLSFADDDLKREVIEDKKNPLNTCYLVDVEVKKMQDKIVFCHILPIHEKTEVES